MTGWASPIAKRSSIGILIQSSSRALVATDGAATFEAQECIASRASRRSTQAIAGAPNAEPPSRRADPDSERRFVTILRADVIDSTGLVADLDPEEAVSRLEPALAAMRGAVRQFGGIVSKELGDGLAAVFGAPIADDNHAPLACHAAIELVRRVGSLGDPGLQVRVGLHSGHVVAYMVASEFSKVYEIGGAAQHLGRAAGGGGRGESDLRVARPARNLRTVTSGSSFSAARRYAALTSLCRSTGSWARATFRAGGCDGRVASPGLSTARPSGPCWRVPSESVQASRQTVLLIGDAGIGNRGSRTSSSRSLGPMAGG